MRGYVFVSYLLILLICSLFCNVSIDDEKVAANDYFKIKELTKTYTVDCNANQIDFYTQFKL